VSESAVVGVPHADLGEAAIAVIVAEPSQHIDLTAIKEALDPRMARFKQPKRLFVVDALPRNAMGKVQKNELRRCYRDVFEAVPADNEPESG